MKEKTKRILSSAALGAASGFVNGFFGTGGGIVILFVSLFFGKGEGEDKDKFASTAIITAVFSAASLLVYFFNKGGELKGSALIYCLPALVGGGIGALLLDRLDSSVTKKIFSAVVMIGGALLLLR